MAQLRYVVSAETETAMWELKDKLRLLSKDPAAMHRAEFVSYLEAKADQIFDELVAKGMPTEQAVKAAQVRLNEDLVVWKQAAKRKGRKGRKNARQAALSTT